MKYYELKDLRDGLHIALSEAVMSRIRITETEVQAFQTVLSTSSIPSAAAALDVPGIPRLAAVATSAVVPPATPDHFMNDLRETFRSITGEVTIGPFVAV